MSDIKKIKYEYLDKLNKELSLESVNQIRTELFGKNGVVSNEFKKLSSIPTGGEQGTGLGLAIGKKMIELHGGVLKLNLLKNHGASFSFKLPIDNSLLNKQQ